MWTNLIDNALYAVPEGGRVSVHVGPEQTWIVVRVVDNGEGIPADVAARVFDPFFTTKPGGSGLGLATVHRIVEEHGGSLRVESRVGSGTAVWLRLPRAEDAT